MGGYVGGCLIMFVTRHKLNSIHFVMMYFSAIAANVAIVLYIIKCIVIEWMIASCAFSGG